MPTTAIVIGTDLEVFVVPCHEPAGEGHWFKALLDLDELCGIGITAAGIRHEVLLLSWK